MLQSKLRLSNIFRSSSLLLERWYHCASFQSTNASSLPILEKVYSFQNQFHLDLNTPMVQSVRWRRPLGIKRAKIPHKARALAIELTYEKYNYPLAGLPASETCINAVKAKYVKKEEDNPFEKILAREFLEEVKAGQMFVVGHMHPCTAEELFEQRVLLHRNNMKYLFHNENIAKLAFTGTKYESLLHLYVMFSINIVCYDKDFSKLLKLERQLPFLTILGVVVEDRILSVADLKRAAELPSLPLMHATLLQTLTSQQQTLTRQLNAQQTELAGALQRYSEMSHAETASSTPPSES
ncbi:39S ribosomal protein L10, mitochondrial [Hyalella azteca]|uniref:Large ribosomal subunit protein uL10m n=1 Tax=Hyalella azteca TaxID=294128 RepID=A0A8B7PLM7_HYAAZ|nr:39S ribosomal protein L10, mitochondrial [Hyalella azteca]